MPPEPNDKMDELLKAYADRRRKEAGAPFEMHPATRQMLHAEVARVISRTTPKPGRPRFFNFGRLFLYSSGLAAAVICVAFLIKEQNPVPPSPVFRQKIATAGLDNTTGARAEPLPTETLVTLNNSSVPNEKFAVRGEMMADKKLSLNSGSLAMQKDEDLSMASTNKTTTGATSELAQNNAPAAPADTAMPAPIERAAPTSTDRLFAAKALPQTQQVPGSSSTSAPVVDAAPSPAGILALFEIQLDGEKIRLIDADGSVYTGKIDLPKTQQQQLATSKGQMFSNQVAFANQSHAYTRQQSGYAKESQSSAGVTAGISNSIAPQDLKTDRPAQQQQQQPGYPFHASGKSRSLARFVNMEGTYYAPATVQEQSQNAVSLAKAKQQQYFMDAGGASAGARIQGQAQIGGGASIYIDAVPVPMKAMKAKSQ